jgi:hypothetical protein
MSRAPSPSEQSQAVGKSVLLNGSLTGTRGTSKNTSQRRLYSVRAGRSNSKNELTVFAQRQYGICYPYWIKLLRFSHTDAALCLRGNFNKEIGAPNEPSRCSSFPRSCPVNVHDELGNGCIPLRYIGRVSRAHIS